MSDRIRLTFPSYDNRIHARVGHGAECVVLMIEDTDYSRSHGGIILTPDEAHALGTRLRQQAKASRSIVQESEAHRG